MMAGLSAREPWRLLALGAAATTMACAVGAAAVAAPRLGVAMGLAALAFGLVARAGERVVVWLYGATLLGTLAFGYGFSNVGIGGAIPLPVADLVLVVLAGWALLTVGLPRHPAFRWMLAFQLIVAVRFTFDFPEYGSLAARDATLAVEVLGLLVGYALIRRFGRTDVVRALAGIFAALSVWFLAFPVSSAIGAALPTVGLAKDVPLFAGYSASAITWTLFFHALLRPAGRFSYALAGACIPVALLSQSRGLYLAIPIAGFAWVALAGTHHRSAVLRRVGLGAFGVIIVGGTVIAFAPAGRFGPTDLNVIRAQLGTLVGGEGPGTGSLNSRQSFVKVTVEQVRARPYGVLVGVGLGPDLAGGARSGVSDDVRKPHNDYLEAFARLGVIGLVTLIGLLVSTLRPIVGSARTASGRRARFLWWVIVGSVPVLVIAATQPALAYSHFTLAFFTFLGAGLAVASEAGANL